MANNELVPGFDEDREDSLKIQLQKLDDVASCIIITLNGYIDTYNSVFFQKQVGKIISAGFVNLIFNKGYFGNYINKVLP